MSHYIQVLEMYPSCPHLQEAKLAVVKEDISAFIEHLNQAEHVPEAVKRMLIISVKNNDDDDEVDTEGEECLAILRELKSKVTNEQHVEVINDLITFVELPDDASVSKFPTLEVLLEAYPEELGLFTVAGYLASRLSLA